MARLARRRCVSTRQREERRVVIERCRTPSHRGVTLRAIMIELTRNVIRVRRPVKVCCMTIPARVWQVLILIVHVATVACGCLMSTRQRELGVVVIERRWSPH